MMLAGVGEACIGSGRVLKYLLGFALNFERHPAEQNR